MSCHNYDKSKCYTDEKYMKFYHSYDKMLKLGIHEDSKNREKIMELLRYNSLNNMEKLISFNEYIENKQTEQKSIYFTNKLL